MNVLIDASPSVPSLQLGIYKLTLRAKTETWLPKFKGSMLRGAFGSALKHGVCIRQDLNCEVCLVRPSCVYTQLFETLPPDGVEAFRGQKQAPHPYVLEPPLEFKQHYAPGERLRFGLTLIGRALDYLPYVIFAVVEAGRRGFGAERGQFALESVSARATDGQERVIYSGQAKRLAVGSCSLDLEELLKRRFSSVEPINFKRLNLKLHFLTPTRIRVQGDLQSGLTAIAHNSCEYLPPNVC